MRGTLNPVNREEYLGWANLSTFTYQTSEQSEVTVRHASLDARQEVALLPATIDEACTVILHLSEVERFELHGVTGLVWSGRCNPASVNVIAGRERLVLKTSHSLDALIVGIPHSSMQVMPTEAQTNRGVGRAEAYDPEDAVGHRLGLAFLAALESAASARPLAAIHLARALSYHFAFKHAWVQEKIVHAQRCRLTPWQARTAATLLDRGDLQVREIAAACRLSSSAFSRLFRATFLRPPHAWKGERRIEAVKQLLLEAEVSLADVALQAGFSSQASMSRAFLRLVGESPSAWRMNQRQGRA
jgi:AraC-like DNA-binding protein